MTALLHPITVVDQVLEEYRSHLETEFRARDEGLRTALREALDREGFLAQEPFFQAYRPYKPAERWRDLGLDPKLAEVMERRSGSDTAYLHQSEAIEHLLKPGAPPLAVTTGTGSGKTECFLLPVIQNAIDDAVAFKQPGLTTLLIYPMNALANDQEERIRQYLEESGHTYVRVARYDRSTNEAEREKLRSRPPHILLTNYVMLEYLLVRPADREALFANHRCRFVVLDEVHTYRGSLGANIALLFRRLRAHLAHARQDYLVEQTDHRRFPQLTPVATSATIKSIDETNLSKEEVTRLRREAVQAFVQSITGCAGETIHVIGEERVKVQVPAGARWSTAPASVVVPKPGDGEAIRSSAALLAGLPESAPLEDSVRRAKVFWTIGELLAKEPRSVSDLVQRIRQYVPERAGFSSEAVRAEVETALAVGASLDGNDGALRLRVHRFIRGGWRFHRCVDPACGKLYPMGEGTCVCGKVAAPLLLCRSCGADALQLWGGDEPTDLRPSAIGQEWVLYDSKRHDIGADDDDEDEDAAETRTRGGKKAAKELKGKKVVEGSFDPGMLRFSADPKELPVEVVLAPARNRCLVCGGSAGARSIMTSVAMGTSAALRVLAEGVVEGLAREHRRVTGKSKKERLLIFADSRQDAAHQARFITYAGRFDRARRRVVAVLEARRAPMTIDEIVRTLVTLGLKNADNPHIEGKRAQSIDYLPRATQDKMRAWEEAPLLDDLAITAGYRATIVNLGLVAVRYGKLDGYVADRGGPLAASLGLTTGQLTYLCRCLLDEMRGRGALARPLLAYHPMNPSCPDDFRVHAEWERKLKRPQGYPCTPDGAPIGNLDVSEVPDGITVNTAWRRGPRGRPPRLQRTFEQLVGRMGGTRDHLSEGSLLSVLELLCEADLLVAAQLHGYTKSRALLQVSGEALELELVAP